MALDDLAGWIRDGASVVVLTGAGISTESGIPDFRGPQGLWTKDPEAEKLSDIHHYMTDPMIRRKAWQARLNHPAWTAEPNDAHRALAQLETKANLKKVITQNVDGLHQQAGTSPQVLIELHGTIWEVVCMSCDARGPMAETLRRVKAGEEDPDCIACGGILKSATVSFGQSLDEEVVRSAAEASSHCEVFLALGTSLAIYPAAQLPALALEAGARFGIFNAQPTPLDDWAHVRSEDPLSRSLVELVESI